jgi:sulfatase maturation enzyme AslB (radical SAM superfamily)
MTLDKIGFYTLSEHRAKNVSFHSNLQRCELILTHRCNFNCAYCRGIVKEYRGDLSFTDAKHIVDLWTENNLRNIRFSGGEPTLWEKLPELVEYTFKKPSIVRIALSTNGSAPLEFYYKLYRLGVNDFSISLDACCASTANTMAGKNANFDHICNVIKELSKITYCTTGVVLDERNVYELQNIIEYATNLGVSDIRIIPSAQWNQPLDVNIKTDYPILVYRLHNLKNGRHVRGIREADCHKCHLVKDDMVILNDYHFPCIIYMREQGEPIGSVSGKTISDIRREREEWFKDHNSFHDNICKVNCLDVCIDYNNAVEGYL